MPEYRIDPQNRTLTSIPGILERQLSAEAVKIIREGVLDYILVDSTSSAWTIQLVLEEEAAPASLDELAAAIRECLTGISAITFWPCYRGEKIPLERRVALVWDQCVKCLMQDLPGALGWIGEQHWVCDGMTIKLDVSGELGANWLNTRGFPERLADLLSKSVGTDVVVSLQPVNPPEDIGKMIAQQIMDDIQSSQIGNAKNGAGAHANGKKGKAPEAGTVILGRKISGEPMKLQDVIDEEKQVIVSGEVFSKDVRDLRTGRKLITFEITDGTDSIAAKVFEEPKRPINDAFAVGDFLICRGSAQFDRFTNELTLMPNDIMRGQMEKEERVDVSPEKRVELHLHTQMSAMDALCDVKQVVSQAAAWGQPAIAITDHGVVQSFPDAYDAGKKHGIKIIFGMEGYMVDDQSMIVSGEADGLLQEQEFVAFDLETTGLSYMTDEIIEIGAVRIKDGAIKDYFTTFVDPGMSIPEESTRITGITNEMVAGAPETAAALDKFLKFAGNAVLIAHNAEFDMGFIRAKTARYLNRAAQATYVDTLALARTLWPHLRNHKLDTVAGHLEITLGQHHRAADDAATCGAIFLKGMEVLSARGLERLQSLNGIAQERAHEFQKPYHIILLAKNQTGLENLYKLVSLSHTEYFFRTPRLPRHLIKQYHEGLLIGSACESGELFRAIVRGTDHARLESIASFYDYLEIQPLGNNEFMIRAGEASSREELADFNKQIVKLGQRLGKPVVATGDVHFINPEDEVYRRIIQSGQGYEGSDAQAPLYMRTTAEMLAEFDYLTPEEQRWVVIDCPNRIVDAIEDIKPVPDEFCPPIIEGSDEEIRQMAYDRAVQLYGDPLPAIVSDRIEWELQSIIGHGYAVLYLIAHKLVKKSLDDGYLVGSRGSVGSSLIATLCGITEVNPLPAHYLCGNCHYSEFMESGSIGSGVDLPDKDCPKCGQPLKKDGHDIHFATFMGFEGDKEPDIDLNFSGEYQPVVHRYTEELFGKDYVFRAGTITTLAEKTAFGFVKAYLEEHGTHARRAQINRLVKGCTGVKRSTGQHPGGMMVVPPNRNIHQFSPVQYPANDKNAGWITTHFDYHSLSGRLVKLDILGHDDPTVIKMLHDLTGIDPRSVPLDDPDTMRIFSSVEPLGVTAEESGTNLGTLAVPEFGTSFVRQMLEDTKPTTFSELIKISGLSHGTGVWLGNAQELVRSGQAKFADVISARDDIMNHLIYLGVKPKTAFKIMESVRKGRGVSDEDEAVMRQADVPDWYIESCRKISYLFPKAHATAYVMMSFRIAYFKVHYPEAFYATYFTVRANEFDADMVSKGADFLRSELRKIQAKGKEATGKEENLATIIEVVIEAIARGIKFLKVDIYKSDARKFLITTEGLLPPLSSLQGLGENAAQQLAEAAAQGEFMSVEDLKTRARLSSAVIDTLKRHGCLQGMPDSDQLSLFAV